MRLSGVNIYWELAFIGSWQYPLLDIIRTSRAIPCAPRRSCVFPCIGCASESAYVGDYSSIPCDPLRSLYSFILCVLNAISSKPPECTIIFIVSLWIGILRTLSPLNCKKTPLGTKSCRTYGLFWPKLNFLDEIYFKLLPREWNLSPTICGAG